MSSPRPVPLSGSSSRLTERRSAICAWRWAAWRPSPGAHEPWKQALSGKALEPEAVKRASLLAVEGAVDHGANHYKIDLAPRVVARAILKAGRIGMTVHAHGQSKAGRCLGRCRPGNAARRPAVASRRAGEDPGAAVYAPRAAARSGSSTPSLVAKHDCRGPRARDRHGGGRGRARRAPGADAGQHLCRCSTAIDWFGTPPPDMPYLPAGARHHLHRPACRGGRGRDLRAGHRGRRSGQGQL